MWVTGSLVLFEDLMAAAVAFALWSFFLCYLVFLAVLIVSSDYSTASNSTFSCFGGWFSFSVSSAGALDEECFSSGEPEASYFLSSPPIIESSSVSFSDDLEASSFFKISPIMSSSSASFGYLLDFFPSCFFSLNLSSSPFNIDIYYASISIYDFFVFLLSFLFLNLSFNAYFFMDAADMLS